MKNTKSMAARITYLRNDILHMTQAEFASTLKISQTYLSLLESGKKSITEAIISKILTTFRINSDWLISGLGTDQDIFLDKIDPKNISSNPIQLPHYMIFKNYAIFQIMKHPCILVYFLACKRSCSVFILHRNILCLCKILPPWIIMIFLLPFLILPDILRNM